jgi:hypothetical protein
MRKSITIVAIFFALIACVKEDETTSDPTSTSNPATVAQGGGSTGGCTYSGDDVAIRPVALLSGERVPGNPIKFSVANAGWVNYECRGGYSWNFGDGYLGSGYEIYHSFSAAGVSVVTLTTTSSKGVTSTATRSYTIL